MYAYSKKYTCANVVTVYSKFERSTKCFDFYIDNESSVHVRTVKLCRHLKRGKEELRKELEDVLNVAMCVVSSQLTAFSLTNSMANAAALLFN